MKKSSGSSAAGQDIRDAPVIRQRRSWHAAIFGNPGLVLVFGAFFLGAAIIVVNESVISHQRETAMLSRELQIETLNRLFRDQIANEIAALDSMLKITSIEAQSDGLELAALRLRRMFATRPGKPADYVLLDAGGTPVWQSRKRVLDQELVAEHFAAYRNRAGAFHISPARRDAESGNLVVYMSSPIQDNKDGLAGLVLVALDAARFQRIYNEMNLGLGGSLRLLRSDGMVIAQVSAGDITAGRMAGDEAWMAFVKGSHEDCSSGSRLAKQEEPQRIISFCRIDGYPLFVDVSIRSDFALADVRIDSLRDRIVAILLAGLLMCGAWIMRLLLLRQQRTLHALQYSESQFKALNALGSDWYWETDAEYRMTYLSDGFSRTCGRPAADVLGRPVWDHAFITPVGSDWSERKALVNRNAPFRNFVVRYVSPEGMVTYGSISGEPIIDAGGILKGYQGIGKDVTAEIVLRQRLRMQHDVTRILSEKKNVEAAMPAVIETICRTMEWDWGAHRHLDPETLLLTCRDYWLAPGVLADGFIALAMEPKTGDPENGTVSRAITRGEVMWFAEHTPVSLRRSKTAYETGLKSAVAVPIRRSRSSEDALEFFSRRVEVPDQMLIETLEAIGRELGQFMDRVEAQNSSEELERQRRHLLGRLELQLEKMPIACMMQDQDFRIVYSNPATERVFGFTAREMQGRDTADFLVPESGLTALRERRAKLLAGGAAVGGANENLTKDGRIIVCEWSMTPLTDDSGAFTGALVVAQDVTEQTSMVAALEDSEERYRHIFTAAPLPMWVTEAVEPRFLAVNDAALQTYGYSREEFMQMTALELQVPEDRERVSVELLALDVIQPRFFERRHITSDGRQLFVEITAQPFQYGGKAARLIIVNDVTERYAVRRALEESESRFRAIFEQASVGIGIREVSLKPRWLRVNRKLCEILGYSERELLQMTSIDITPEEDLAETHDYNVRLRASTLRSYTRQKRYRRKDGHIIWVTLSVAVVNGADGKPQYLVSVINDISDNVASRQLLQESEGRYRQLFALTPLPMLLRKEAGSLRFLEVNNACLTTYGYTREEMLALTVADVQVPEARERYGKMAEARPTGVIEHVHKKHVRKSGEVFDVEIFSYPLTLGKESVRLTLVRDMTEQLHTEQMLRDSERRIALALEASGGALFDWNVETQEVYLSDHWNVMLGGVAKETHTTFPELNELLHPDDRAAQYAAIVTLLKTGSTPLHTEFRVRDYSGSWLWLESRGSVTERDADGRALRVRGTNIDIMQRKQIEMALHEREAEIQKLNAELEQRVEQRTQALAAVNRELESFSYSVSHDLRAPLRTIDGFSQIVLEEYASGLDDTARDYLERVRAGSRQMGQLIDDLLELARVTRSDLEIDKFDLTALAREITQELQAAQPQRKVSVAIAEGMLVSADAGLLRVAVDNLLRNAWKFTGLLKNAEIEVGCTQTGAGHCYFVRDNGAGFDMTYVNKLFRAFQRLHTEAEFQGTGIGLALVQRIITRHGGQVWAEAEPGRGATFYFTLPEPVEDAGSAGRVKAET